MFGLHAYPSIGVIALVGAAVGLILAVFMARQDKRVAAGVVGMSISIASGAAMTMYTNENYYETRDTLIGLKLAPAGISMVGLEDWDGRAVVKLDNCIASYEIVSVEELNRPGSWPLAQGTGQVREGCTNVLLDQAFIFVR